MEARSKTARVFTRGINSRRLGSSRSRQNAHDPRPPRRVGLLFCGSKLTLVHSVEDVPPQSERRARMPIPHSLASNHEAASGAPPSALGLFRNSTLFRHLDASEADAILAAAQV